MREFVASLRRRYRFLDRYFHGLNWYFDKLQVNFFEEPNALGSWLIDALMVGFYCIGFVFVGIGLLLGVVFHLAHLLMLRIKKLVIFQD